MFAMSPRCAQTGGPLLRSLSWYGSLAQLALVSGCSLFYRLDTTQCETSDDCLALGLRSEATCRNHVCVAVEEAGGSGTGTGAGGMGQGGTGAGVSKGGTTAKGSNGGTAGAVGGSAGATAECQSNSDCLDSKAYASPHICKSGKCVSLVSNECPYLLGDDPDHDPNHKNLRAAAPIIVGAYASYNDANWHESTAVMNLEMAINEFNDKGLPSTVYGTRPFVAVLCQSNNTNNTLDVEAGMRHLTVDLEVPGIMSGLLPDDLLKAATFNRTVARPALIASASMSNSTLAALQDNGLLWHMMGNSTQFVAPTAALVGYAEEYVNGLRQQAYDNDTASPKTAEDPKVVPLRITLVDSDNQFYHDVSMNLIGALRFNGKSALENAADGNFKQVAIESELTHSSPNVKPAIDSLTTDPRPHIIVVQARNEFIQGVIPQVDNASWPKSQPRPFYVLGYGMDNREPLTTRASDIVNGFGIGSRVVGVNYVNEASPTDYSAYKLRLQTAYPQTIPTTGLQPWNNENYYDSAYYLLYSVAASMDLDRYLGTDLRDNLKTRVVTGVTPVTVGTVDPQAAPQWNLANATQSLFLLSTYSVRLTGLMGPPNFTSAGTRVTPVGVYCLNKPTVATVSCAVGTWCYEHDVLRWNDTLQQFQAGSSYPTFPCINGFYP